MTMRRRPRAPGLVGTDAADIIGLRLVVVLAAVAASGMLACRTHKPSGVNGGSNGTGAGAGDATGNEPPDNEVWLSPELSKASQVVEVRELELPQAVRVGGKVAFDDLRVSHVFTPVTGRVTQIHAQPGQKVRRGSPLVTLASPDVGSAFSDLVKADSDLVTARADFVRQQKLVAAQAAAQRDLETAEDNFAKARAEWDRSREKAKLLSAGSVDTVSQQYTLRSFIDGEVIARNVNLGMEVQGLYSAGNAVELFTVGDTDEVWVYADVPEEDLPRVKLGARVTAKVVAYPDREFHGKVEWISTTVDPTLRTGRIRCSLPNQTGELLPEMYASVSIETSTRRALALKHEAVIPINNQVFAFLSTGERPDGRTVLQRRRVRVAEVGDAAFVEVLDGLKAGDKVIIEANATHKDANDEARITPEQMEAAGIRVEKAEVRAIEDALTIGGRLTFDDLRVTHVYPPVTGRVSKVVAAPGQRVEKGAALALIESPDLASAYSDAVKARADLTATLREYQRQKELFEAHAGARKDLEAAENAYRKAKAEYARAEERRQLLRAGRGGDATSVSQEYTLRSPIDGEIIARNVNPGMEVQGQYSGAGQAIELFTIGETDRLLVLGDLYELDLPHVAEGAPVRLRVPAYPDKVFTGTVEWISNVLDAQLRTAKVRCTVENPERLLKPEMYEMVTVAVPAERMLAVPREAVLRQGAETIVFVAAGTAEDGELLRFRRRVVKVNEQRPSGLVPIAGGLEAGESVVVDGAVFLLGLI